MDKRQCRNWMAGFGKRQGFNMPRNVVCLMLFVGVCAACAEGCSSLFNHCHLTDHIHGGMMAPFNIAGQAPVQKLDGKVRGV
jgi:hypothetical protein